MAASAPSGCYAVVLVNAGESFRMREARTRGGGVPLKVD